MKTLGLIGGTGLDAWGDPELELSTVTPYGAASCEPRSFSLPGVRLLFIPRHGPHHDIAPHEVNYRANVWALKEAGATDIIAVNAVGGITARFGTGALALPDQLVDYTWGRAHTYSSGPDSGLQHIDFTHPFSAALRAALASAAEQAGITLLEGGCIGVTQGPRLETAAEIRRMERDGCDLVGMTTMPEAALAAELGLRYAAIAMVVNRAAGKGDEAIDIADVEAEAAKGAASIRKILGVFLKRPPQA